MFRQLVGFCELLKRLKRVDAPTSAVQQRVVVAARRCELGGYVGHLVACRVSPAGQRGRWQSERGERVVGEPSFDRDQAPDAHSPRLKYFMPRGVVRGELVLRGRP